ncbi:hypothetical protein [Pseudomonas monsensis]
MKAREFSQYPVSDPSSKGQNAQAMNAVSRDEFNARIETIETRMDARVEGIRADFREFLAVQAERDKRRDQVQAERDNTRDQVQAERDHTQTEREKTQTERDKRYDMISQEMREIAKRVEDAARQGSTVKANVWAATAVKLLGIVAIVVGGYYANQANMYVAMQTTLAAVQAGRDISVPTPSAFPSLTPP